ncbi:ACP S-malonyltransferase [Ruegeria sp.]|uniref:ACP S-malonyltransferase n=1 Tax=Ruegeria sp. TaxID=1879320 RepID=UPI003C79E337
MSSAKQTAVVICPGRGTYNKPELGVLGRQFTDKALLAQFDEMRRAEGQDTLSDLDGAARYSIAKHTRGDNASALIYAATLGDFRAIDPEKVEVVAVTGNSMGWYSALACGGALTAEAGFKVVNTMGTLMQQSLIGGQLIYPFMDADWHPNPVRKADLLALVEDINGTDATLTLSIDLGGMLVLAGDDAGLSAFEETVPVVQERFPMRLANHAGFHSHLQTPVAETGRTRLGAELFRQPNLPMIDGRGQIWWPGACDTNALWDYTLGHQVTETYDFTRAISQAAREFAPDVFIVTGPGSTLGGAVAQSLILADWVGLEDKTSFQTRQTQDPVLISMGIEDQRIRVI